MDSGDPGNKRIVMTYQKTPSDALFQKIDAILRSSGKTRDAVIAVFKLGREEGFTDFEIADLIRANWSRV